MGFVMFHKGDKLHSSLTRTRQSFFGRIAGLFAASDVTDATWEELESLLIGADVGAPTTIAVVNALRARVDAEHIRSAGQIQALLKSELVSILRTSPHVYLESAAPLSVILVVGVNGSGKTTSIAKLAWFHLRRGDKVMLAAADTFRAAAIDQLKIWGGRVGAEVVGHQPGADPGAVLFDAISSAQSRRVDVLIVDTAGRLQTKHNLMQELGKIARVAARQCPGAPHETLLVVDAATGQNGLSQARLFSEVTPVTGLFLTKIDGTAKGGIVFAIERELGLPVLFLGTGEHAEDVAQFDAEAFVEELFE